jgi:cytosine/uracil/thiamine/allantoin permease
LNLLALGLKVERYKSVLIDGVLVVAGAVFVMLIEQDFFGPFLSFLQLLAVGLAAWVAVFLVDMALRRGYDPAALIDTGPTGRYRYRGGINLGAVFAWGLGILVGLSFTSSPLFAGPLAMGVFTESSLGYFIGFLVTAVSYYLLARLGLVRLEPEPGHGRPAAESAAETRDSTGT